MRRYAGPLGLALLVALWFWPYFLQGRIPLNEDWMQAQFYPWKAHPPATLPNPEVDDPILAYYPMRVLVAEQLRQGHLPLWNPMSLCGLPTFGTAQPLNPWNLLFLVLPGPHAWTWMLLLQTLITGLTTFALLRELDVAGPARFLGAAAFMLSTCMTVNLEWPYYAGTFGWLPLVLLAVERNARQPSARWVGAGALGLGLMVYCGSLQLAAYCWAATLLLMAFRARKGRFLLACGLMLALGGGATLVEAQANRTLVAAIDRSPVKYADLDRPAALLTYVWRDIFGNPVTQSEGGPPFVAVNRMYSLAFSAYVGLWMLMLAVPVRLDRQRAPYAVLAAGIPVFIILTSLPGLREALLRAAPGFFIVDHYRASALAALGLSVLGACSFSDLSRNPTATRRWLLFWSVAGGLALVTLLVLERLPDPEGNAMLLHLLSLIQQNYGEAWISPYLLPALCLGVSFLAALRVLAPRNPRLFQILVVTVVTLDLLVGAAQWTRFAPNDLPATPSIAYLQQHLGEGRFLGIPPGARPIQGREDVLPPNVGILFGLRDARGYVGVVLKRHAFLRGPDPQVNRFHWVFNPSWPLSNLLSVKYLVSQYPFELPDWKLVHQDDLYVYENQKPHPRAFVVQKSAVVTPEAIAQVLQTPGLEPHGVLLLSPGDVTEAPSQQVSSGPWAPARLLSETPDRVELETQADFAGYAVLTDSWFEGWEATVDGRPERILPAYYALRAVPVPAGKHSVVFRFVPRTLIRLTLLSWACMLLALALLLWPRSSRSARYTAADSSSD